MLNGVFMIFSLHVQKPINMEPFSVHRYKKYFWKVAFCSFTPRSPTNVLVWLLEISPGKFQTTMPKLGYGLGLACPKISFLSVKRKKAFQYAFHLDSAQWRVISFWLFTCSVTGVLMYPDAGICRLPRYSSLDSSLWSWFTVFLHPKFNVHKICSLNLLHMQMSLYSNFKNWPWVKSINSENTLHNLILNTKEVAKWWIPCDVIWHNI